MTQKEHPDEAGADVPGAFLDEAIRPLKSVVAGQSSPPSDHLVAGFMLPSVVGALSATSCHQNGIGEPI